MVSKEDAIQFMNKQGAKGEPFVFLATFDGNHIIATHPENADFLFAIGRYKNYQDEHSPYVSVKPAENNFSAYETTFNAVQKHIAYGNTYLTNVTMPVLLNSDSSMLDIFHAAKAPYRILTDSFVVFSPETFVKISGGFISTYPMKGTIKVEGESSRQELLENQKERDEHATTVDLLRNDLSMVATSVRVRRYRYVSSITSATGEEYLQVSSEISGLLPEGYQANIGSIISTLLPAGSVTGAPKQKTVAIIKAAESYERGFYTGVAGYFDGENLDSCVMIRFIEEIDGKLYFKAGGGVTHQSRIKDEYQELMEKIYVPVS